MDRITIVTPTYNAAADILACLESVACQTYPDVEHLIIDGLSSDGTPAIVEAFCRHNPRVRLVSEPDAGIYDAMNKSLALASGDWLFFLGSDDVLFAPDTLAEIMKHPEAPRSDILYGNVLWKSTRKVYDGHFTAYDLLLRNICHQSIFYRRTVFERFGAYNLRYRTLGDWEFNLRWFNDPSVRVRYVPLIVAVYNGEGVSQTMPDDAFQNDKPTLAARLPLWSRTLYAMRRVPGMWRLHLLVNWLMRQRKRLAHGGLPRP